MDDVTDGGEEGRPMHRPDIADRPAAPQRVPTPAPTAAEALTGFAAALGNRSFGRQTGGGGTPLARMPMRFMAPPTTARIARDDDYTPSPNLSVGEGLALGKTATLNATDAGQSPPADATWNWKLTSDDAKVAELASSEGSGREAAFSVKGNAVGCATVNAGLSFTGGGQSKDGGNASAAVKVPDIEVNWGTLEITPGTHKKDEPRDADNVWLDDTIKLTAEVTGIDDGAAAGIEATAGGNLGGTAPEAAWSGNKVTWTWKAEHTGPHDGELCVEAPGGTKKSFGQALTISTSIDDYIKACEQASIGLQARYDPAITALQNAGTSIDRAIQSFKNGMEDKSAYDKNEEDKVKLIVSFLTAGASGAGAQVLTNFMGDGAKSAEGAAVTNTVKKVLDWAAGVGVNAAAKPSSGGSGGGAISAESEIGRRFTALAGKLSGDKASVASTMEAAIGELRAKERSMGEDAATSLPDPVEAVGDDPDLAALSHMSADGTYQKVLAGLWDDWAKANLKKYVTFYGKHGAAYWNCPDFIFAGAKAAGTPISSWVMTYAEWPDFGSDEYQRAMEAAHSPDLRAPFNLGG